ncbi:hypothetical protein [Pseudanabaena minima]|uniref:hypothetical protein n=1 Tax=Pseudanabaena minima TaxID=890415 RepID=UPI003DA9D863
MASIVLSFVGQQDPFGSKTGEGSIVTLIRALVSQGTVIKRAILIYTEGTATGAKETKEWLMSELGIDGGDVELVPASWELSNDPTDLLKAAQEARRGLDLARLSMEKGDRIEFNASSGTPAMKSAFSLLQAAGYAANGQVWQVRNPTEIKENQTRVFQTDVGVLRREFDLKVVKGQIEGFNYGSALANLEESGLAERSPMLVNLLKAGIAWHQGQFDQFYRLAKSFLSDAEKRQGESWWWMAYEQAYTALVRLQQENTSEAMQHSFRAVEGGLWEWVMVTFPDDVVARDGKYPLLKPSMLLRYPSLRRRYDEQLQKSSEVEVRGYIFRDLLEAHIPSTATSIDFNVFWDSARVARNVIAHRLGGISERSVLMAWGEDIRSRDDLERRLLGCLNAISGKQYRSLAAASLFAKIHARAMAEVAAYQP